MRLYGKLILFGSLAVASSAALIALFGCEPPRYSPPEQPMPPNTILLSQMMRELSAKPGFTEALLKQLDDSGKTGGAKKKKGPAFMTPDMLDELRRRIVGKDWSGLERFPGWSMRRINPAVRVVGHYAGKDEKLEATSEVHPGSSLNAAQAGQFLDIGPYALDRTQSVSLDTPSTLSPLTAAGLVTTLGDGVVRGDGPNELAPEHAESQRLADLLNRLAANELSTAAPFTVTVAGRTVTSPQFLIGALLEEGAQVTVNDARYFANFGHLHYNGQDVMMPFWVDSGLTVPHANGRHLLIPVSHAELEWQVRGSRLNADVSYYFGIDGKSEWRTMDTLDQAWVLKRTAHSWTGAQAVEATRLAGLLTVAYMHQHAARPKLPFGGYYALGVCQDVVSAVEHALTGHVTLFPNTVDAALFNDPRDAEVNALMHAIPKDRDGHAPTPDRIFGSLPAGPGANGDFAAITIPGLREDLAATYAAWQTGELSRPHSALFTFGVIGTLAILAMLLQRRRGQRK